MDGSFVPLRSAACPRNHVGPGVYCCSGVARRARTSRRESALTQLADAHVQLSSEQAAQRRAVLVADGASRSRRRCPCRLVTGGPRARAAGPGRTPIGGLPSTARTRRCSVRSLAPIARAARASSNGSASACAHPALELLDQLVVVRDLRRCDERRLRRAVVDQQVASDGRREVRAAFADHGEREIDVRERGAGGDDVLVGDQHRGLVELDRRERLPERRAEPPGRRRAAAVEHAGAAEHERAGTRGGDTRARARSAGRSRRARCTSGRSSAARIVPGCLQASAGTIARSVRARQGSDRARSDRGACARGERGEATVTSKRRSPASSFAVSNVSRSEHRPVSNTSSTASTQMRMA